MSRRWLLFLLCLSLLFLSFVQLTRAGADLRVDETQTRILLQKDPVEVLLAIDNATGTSFKAHIHLELLDPANQIVAQANSTRAIANGNQIITQPLQFFLSKLTDLERQRLLWYRLRYRVIKEGASDPTSQGIISVSELAPDLFEIRVSASEVVKEGGRYRAVAMAYHPLTNRPIANVVVDGELTLEANDDKTVKLRSTKTTDATGVALFDFAIPPRFPQFPHNTRPSGGEIRVVARKGAVVTEARGEVLVDQFVKTLITTDKPLYQPGQVMHLRALLFTPSRQALANHDIRFKIVDPEDLTVSTQVVKSSRFGIATVDWTIPESTRLGNYLIYVGIDGGDQSSDYSHNVRISRYELPNFTVAVEPDRKYYLPGQDATVKVKADYLFGQPVKRGRVRVVRETERDWNYREQKWQIVEGDKYEGQINAGGFFTAQIKLDADHDDLSDESYSNFRDVRYAAYVTDPTTNRTEQRMFDLRVTKESIHIYIVEEYSHHSKLPLEFYVSASYADGTPAACNVDLKLIPETKTKQWSKSLGRVRTNRYGLAKVSGVSLPREFDSDADDLELVASASDARGLTGRKTEDLSFSKSDIIQVTTGKALYRAGEPIIASITSTIQSETVFVDVIRDSSVIRSERVRLKDGRGSIVFPYRSDLNDRLTLVAYSAAVKERLYPHSHTILYPRTTELKIDARSSRPTYQPGEMAHVNLNLRGSQGTTKEGAFGVVVLDKAVEERFRTESEFGGRYDNSGDMMRRFLGLDEEIGGVTLRDLQNLPAAKLSSPELDLVTEVLLNQSREYYLRFHGPERYSWNQSETFGKLVVEQLTPVREVLTRNYLSNSQYPTTTSTLESLLREAHIDFSAVRDPWGVVYRPEFIINKESDVLILWSNGADKRPNTTDDFVGERFAWRYFNFTGMAIDSAIQRYHNRTGGFIRDYETLRQEMSESVALDGLRDRWGERYRFDFEVRESNYVLSLISSGPDKRFSLNYGYYTGDDFSVWSSKIDYFAEPRAQIQNLLNEKLQTGSKFPHDEQRFREALGQSAGLLDGLRDPWGHRYYITFKTSFLYADRVRIENRNGEVTNQRTSITPVTRTVGSTEIRSLGKDGTPGTLDDFTVATFSGVISEQERGGAEAKAVQPGTVFSDNNGAIGGVVTDPTGSVVPGAKVKATQADDSRVYEASTNEVGKYSLSDLPPGLYQVRFESPGFRLHVFTNILVRTGNLTEVNVALEPGQTAEYVTVTAAAESLKTEKSVNASRSTVDRSLGKFSTKPGAQISTPRLRQYFPETLLWQPSLETDKFGRARLDFKLADNITTWKLAVIGSTKDGQIGTAETEIKAFQPFFVEHDPPRILTEGDEISLPLVVRNYLGTSQLVDLEITPANWFSLLGPTRKQTTVAAGDAKRQIFDLRAASSIKDGKQRVTAIGRDGNDAIEKVVTVHPDGEERSASDSDMLDSSAKLQLDLPDATIRNSERSELTIYPNVMAHVVESVEAIMSRPYGCGEQVISSSYPSLLLLRYHKNRKQDFDLRVRAERYVNQAYSQLLNYRDENGGFTYWGRGEPDVALTAYALRFLTEAATVVPVDAEVIAEAHRWLLKQQQRDGGWKAYEYWNSAQIHRRSALLTAYIARVLAVSAPSLSEEDARGNSVALKRALDNLAQRSAEIDEPYLLASYALAAFELKDQARAKPIIQTLFSLAHQEGNATYWSLETNTPFYGWGMAGRVETTALVLQALTKYCELKDSDCEANAKTINRALYFLLKKKDAYSVWYSTQATVNVLDAMLSLFSSRSDESNRAGSMSADLVVNGRVVQTIDVPIAIGRIVNPITVDITKYLQAGKNAVEIKRGDGGPLASVQLRASYYVPWTVANHKSRSGDLQLEATFSKTEGKVGDEITCHVEAERVGFKGYGMMLAEIGLPPGADVDRSTLETAMKNSGWSISQYDVLPDRVVFYLWPRAGGVKFDFKFRPRFGVNAKTAASIVYDYYNPDARAVVGPAKFRVRE